MRFETRIWRTMTVHPRGAGDILIRPKECIEIVSEDFNQAGKWRTIIRMLVFVLSIWCAGVRGAHAQDPQAAAGSSHVPVIDGEVGRCSIEFTVNDAAGVAVYNAKIRVYIAYGFLSLRKLDLEIGTNSNGKARFDGLPNKGKALLFRVTQGNRNGSVVYHPTEMCTEHALVVLKD